jgi:hypothetical protein
LDSLDGQVAPLESELSNRLWTVMQMLAKEIDVNDPAMIAAVWQYVGGDRDKPTVADVGNVGELCGQMRAGHTVLVATDDGFTIQQRQQGAKQQ